MDGGSPRRRAMLRLARRIASAGGLEFQMELSCKGSVAGLGLDFTESSEIDIQVGITGRGMVQDVARINAQRHASRFRKPDPLLKIRIEAPAYWPINRIQAQCAELSRRGILQNDLAAGIGDCGIRAKCVQTTGRRDIRTHRIGYSLVSAAKIVSVCAAPSELTVSWKVPDDIRRTCSIDGIPRDHVQRSAARHIEDRAELPSSDHMSQILRRVAAQPFARTER